MPCWPIADATQCLVQAEIALRGVLTLDGANSKALYRRALALFRQGREAEAWADLECIQGGPRPAAAALPEEEAHSCLCRAAGCACR